MPSDNEIQVVITASDKASSIIAGVSKSMKLLVGAVTDITKEYIEYGDEVKKLSTFTGMQSDETSRLIQLSDDAFVSFDTLRMSAKYMSDNGIAPNIENLAKLSDQFLAIKDPLAQSQFLVDNFSRAGMEMGNIMALSGDKIREMGASIDQSLIITPEKLASIQAGKVALDNFNDSLMGMRFEAAGTLLDIFQKLPTPIKNVTLAIGSIVNSGMLASLSQLVIIFGSLGKLGPAIQGAATALKAFAVGEWAVLGPALAVAAAIAAVGYMMYKAFMFGVMLGNIFKQLLDLFRKFPQETLNSIFRVLFGGGRANGGPVSSGTAYIVGERGPELFVPPQSGTIMSNETLSTASGRGGGNNTFVLEYSPMISLADRAEVLNKFGPIVREAMRGA
jgi:hypothetical protein